MKLRGLLSGASALLSLLISGHGAWAADTAAELIAEAEAYRQSYQFQAALSRYEDAARAAPSDYRIHKARGDLLATRRRHQEALVAYRRAAALNPDALELHWALWALLDRIGPEEQALLSLQEIARLDSDNPLAHLRLARALYSLDRFEDATQSFQRVVELDPEQLVYRLLLARAYFDVLDYPAARREVDTVLTRARKGSPEWGAAQNLRQVVRGETTDQGARDDFNKNVQIPGVDMFAWRKAWAFAREKAWQLMKAGRFGEAEQALGELLTIHPDDHQAYYDLGITLIKLDRCEEAIVSFEKGIRLNKYSEFYADSVFQMGRCLATLGRWTEAIPRYRRVLDIQDWGEEYFYALNFPDIPKVQEALQEARHSAVESGQGLSPEPKSRAGKDRHEPFEIPLPPLAEGQSLRAPISIQVDFAPIVPSTSIGWFVQLVLSGDVLQEDLQTGQHEFLAIDPKDTFLPDDAEIYVVFTLTTASPDEVVLTSRWVAERTFGLPPNTLVGTDQVAMRLNEGSGYFLLSRPEGGWSTGTYRVDFYVGEEATAYTHMADVRFRVIPSSQLP